METSLDAAVDAPEGEVGAAARGAARTSPAAPRAREHVAALDGLRGIAILLVMMFHFTMMIEPENPLHSRVLGLTTAGWCGVDLFFVLSGFLITGILIDTRGRAHYLRDFYVRRALRILPLYYGVLVALLVIGPWIVPGAYLESQHVLDNQGWIWLHATNFLVAYHGFPAATTDWLWLSHFWSLAIEEHFYLLWPLLVMRIDRERLLWLCGAMISLPLALRMVIDDPMARYLFTPCRVDALGVGCFIALASRGGGGIGALVPAARGVAGLTGAALAVVLLANERFSWADPRIATAGLSLLAVFFGAVLILAATAPPGGVLGRVLEGRPLGLLGRYSYGAYVLHHLFQPLSGRIFPAAHWSALTGSPLLAMTLVVLCSSALTFVLAAASYHLLERPFLSLKRHF